VLVIRHRRGGPITRAAKHLPAITHESTLPLARASDRWITGRAAAARKQREQIIEEVSSRIAENQAQAQRRANPLWRRAAGTALETAASAGVAALVQRSMSQPTASGAAAAGTDTHSANGSAGEYAAVGSDQRSTANARA
jgi:hypothetical protein